jgi:succinyl-CoA synthetase beta subunit
LKAFPVVFRVPGSWEDEGYKILEKYGIKYFGREHTMEDAAKYVVEMRKKIN